jgi:hypothetical protein
MVKKREIQLYPPGGDKTMKLAVLEAGAKLLQSPTPLKDFDIYVIGFHCAKHMTEMQMEAHHYCKQVNEDFLQCVVFDGNTENANLIGVEYIISERLYEQLPDGEGEYWHPHNYEILSGTLVAPNIPAVAEKAMLKLLMNSYGKTWHFWHTGRHDGKGTPGHKLPIGEAMLMWSFNRDGEMDPDLLEDYQHEMDIDVGEKREQREDFVEFARPQHGVDALKGRFPGASQDPPPGVREKGNS